MRYLALGRSRLIWSFIVLLVAFWGVAPFFLNDYVFIVVNALALTGALGVMVAYLPGTASRLWKPIDDLNGGDLLVVGIGIAWAYSAARFIWGWVYYGAGKPDFMAGNLISAWMIWGLFLAAVLHQLARGAVKGYIPSRNWARAGIWVGIGLTTAGMLITYLYLTQPGGP